MYTKADGPVAWFEGLRSVIVTGGDTIGEEVGQIGKSGGDEIDRLRHHRALGGEIWCGICGDVGRRRVEESRQVSERLDSFGSCGSRGIGDPCFQSGPAGALGEFESGDALGEVGVGKIGGPCCGEDAGELVG